MARPDLAGWRLLSLSSGLAPLSFMVIGLLLGGETKSPWLAVGYVALLVWAGIVAALLAYKMGRRGWLWFVGCVFWGLPAAVLAFLNARVIISPAICRRPGRHKTDTDAASRPRPQPATPGHPRARPLIACDFCLRFAATHVTWYAVCGEPQAAGVCHDTCLSLAVVACPSCHGKLVRQRLWFKMKRTFLAVRIMVYACLLLACLHGMSKLGLPPAEIAVAFIIIPIVEGVALAKKFDKTTLPEPKVAMVKAANYGLVLDVRPGSDFFPLTDTVDTVCADEATDLQDRCAFCGAPPATFKQVKLERIFTSTTLHLGMCSACRRRQAWRNVGRMLLTLSLAAVLVAVSGLLAYWYFLYGLDWTKAFTGGLVVFGCLIAILTNGVQSFFDPHYLARATPVVQRYAAHGYCLSDCIELIQDETP